MKTGMKRDEKKDMTRAALTDAATALFLDKGFDAATVDEIAAKTGVSQRTFFRYFPTKFDVAFPYSKERFYEFKKIMEQHAGTGKPFSAVRSAMLTFATYFRDHGERMEIEYRMIQRSTALFARDMEIDHQYEVMIASEFERSTFSPTEARIIASAVFGGVGSAVAEWVKSGRKQELVEIGMPLLKLLDILEAAFTVDGSSSSQGRR